MARACPQSCVRWRAKPLQQRPSAGCEDLVAGAPAEQGPATREEVLSQVTQAMGGAQWEGHMSQHGSASALDMVDDTAELASCNQR